MIYSARDWNAAIPRELYNRHAWTTEVKSLVTGETIADVGRRRVAQPLVVNQTAVVR